MGVANTAVPALPNAVNSLAKTLGYYQKNGLDVTVVTLTGTPLVVSGLLSGELDVGNVGTDDVLRLVGSQGVDIRGIHTPDPRQYFMIIGKSSIESVKDLTGKTYGVASRGSLDDSLSRSVMTKLGVPPAGVNFLNIGDPATRAKILVAGQVDATTMSIGTWVTIEDQPGVKVLVGVDDYFNAAPVVAKVNAAMGARIREKPEQMQKFTNAIIETSRALASDENLWTTGMGTERPDMDARQLHELWLAFRYSWAVNGYTNLTQNQATADYFYASDPFKDVPHVDVRKWTDTTFVDAFLKANGVDKRMDDPGRVIN